MMTTLRNRAVRALESRASVAGRTVLRLGRHWVDGRIRAPRHSGVALSALLIGSSVAYGSSLGGQAASWGDAAAAGLGYGVVDLALEGASETDEAAIAAAIGLDGTRRSLPAIDVAAARNALVALPWVDSATVAKQYPGTLRVALKEREAVARWMLGERVFLIDADGEPIVEADGRALPLVVGEGADAHVADALALRVAVPEVTASIKAMVRVGSRRWDVVTHTNVIVMLPADAPEAALARLARLQADQRLLDKEIAAVDLRITDRMTVRLTPEAAARREQALADAEKARKTDRKAKQVQL